MLFRSPSTASSLMKLAWIGSTFHFRFGTLAFWHIGPFGGRDLGASSPQRGLPLGQFWAWPVPLSLSAILCHHMATTAEGGGVVTLHSVRVYTPCGLTLFAPSVPLPPGGVGGTPGRTSLGLSPSSGQYVLHRILMTILSGPCLELPHC